MFTHDFASRPPEINSTLIHGGDGSTTLLTAAAAWNALAVNLRSAAASYQSVVTRLVAEQWFGPSSAAMAGTLAPYAGWMQTTAGIAEHTALQVKNAAAAFEAAIAVTVPPATVFANRAHAQNLVTTNIFGQNTAAIQAAESQYLEMWAQCAAAMHSYANGASTAVQLAGFDSPGAQNANTGDFSQADNPDQADIAGRGEQNPTTSLARWFDSSESDGWFGDPGGGGLGPNANLWNTLTSTDMANPAMVTSVLADLATVQEFNEAAPGAFAPGSFAPVAPAMSTMGAAGLVNAGGLAGTPPAPTAVSAAMGRAMGVGTLSAPPAWGAVAPVAPSSTILPGHSPAAATHGGHGAPGVPVAARNSGPSTGPRYGVRPTIMARPPSAGYAPELF